ncbi:MAG: hypothetical protein HKN03_06960 [Acidimicrobiales bacterium]|nr:hypothetical protein [Acidimicrobiales bacterium]
MKWRFILIALVVAVGPGGCSTGSEADQDPSNQPSVTVLGTAVEEQQPDPTLGSAISTER